MYLSYNSSIYLMSLVPNKDNNEENIRMNVPGNSIYLSIYLIYLIFYLIIYQSNINHICIGNNFAVFEINIKGRENMKKSSIPKKRSSIIGNSHRDEGVIVSPSLLRPFRRINQPGTPGIYLLLFIIIIYHYASNTTIYLTYYLSIIYYCLLSIIINIYYYYYLSLSI
jgi:hypothetical protein